MAAFIKIYPAVCDYGKCIIRSKANVSGCWLSAVICRKPINPERFEQIIKDNLPQEYVTECGDGNGDTVTGGQETDGTPDLQQAEEWSIPGIDIAKALSYIGGSRELYISLLQTYLDGSEERIQKLEECKNKEDIFNYDITIHGLKGISAKHWCRFYGGSRCRHWKKHCKDSTDGIGVHSDES